ncbi:pilus assembly protein TadG-related protein [Microbacterium sp. AGC62]|uniref:pilus assembly protein TadG-related protein n=1 Tax=Microbacterium TaxID=33882 RepID=UPI002905E383|nr:pilus assembly protein TadG-related protein [Microbacterium sp. Mcb102]
MSGRSMRGARAAGMGDDGSTLPLILGYVLLTLVVIFVCVCATDLYLAQKRLDALADSAALAGADGFTVQAIDGAVRAELTDAAVTEQAAELVSALPGEASLVSARTPDGVSARVTVAASWHPPLLSPFVPDGVRLESTATSRTALR